MEIKIAVVSGSIKIVDQESFKEVEITKNVLSRQTEKFTLSINNKDFERIKVEIGCGCTRAEVEGENINFEYTPSVLGVGRKKVTIFAFKNGESVKQVIYIKANVI